MYIVPLIASERFLSPHSEATLGIPALKLDFGLRLQRPSSEADLSRVSFSRPAACGLEAGNIHIIYIYIYMYMDIYNQVNT